jgi:hypothetical protein
MSRQIHIGTDPDGGVVSVPEEAFKQHAVVFGGSGFGKTFFSYILAVEQMKQGASLVVVDYKREGVRRMLGACEALRIDPRRVHLIDSAEPGNAPGMNPFLVEGVSPEESAADFMTLYERSVGFSGPRMKTFLDHAVRIIAWHKKTIFEIPHFLINRDFREALLKEPTDFPKNELYQLSQPYLLGRYMSYSPSDRDGSIQALEVALDNFARSRLLLRLFNAPRNTVNLDAFFTEQRILLVNFGPGGGMNEASGMFLAAFAVNQLMAAAARGAMNNPHQRRPVVLMADEFRKISGFMEEGLRDVANMSRERGIRLLIAAQHPDQIPEGMRADLRVSSAVKAFFNPGDDTTESAAKYLSIVCPDPGAEDEAEELREEEDYSHVAPYRGKVLAENEYYPKDGLIDVEAYEYENDSGSGEWVMVDEDEVDRMDAEAEKRLNMSTIVVDPNDTNATIRAFMADVPEYLPPLFLGDARKVSNVARELPYGCVRLFWKDGVAFAHVEVPKPVRKQTTSKPSNRSAREFWNSELNRLQISQAIVNITGTVPQFVDVTPIQPQTDASQQYADAVNGLQDAYSTVPFSDYLVALANPKQPEKPGAFVPDDSIE